MDRLSAVGRHDALILLRSCFGAPKLQHVLRTSPCHGHPALLEIDNLLRTGLCGVVNCLLSDTQWIQARLPVRDGGLGVRDVTSLAIPAFLASAASTRGLQDAILSAVSTPPDTFVSEYVAEWTSRFSVAAPVDLIASRQSAWSALYIQADKAAVLESATDSYSQARVLAVSAPHSSDWLHALPIAACGLRLDDEAVRIAVGLRLGVAICVPHPCPCGVTVDARGAHGLSCKQAAGRSLRHHQLNDLVWRAFQRAAVPAKKEPSGLLRSDGKRPDGITLLPWSSGRAVAWDVTVADTVAESYLGRSSSRAGAVAEFAATKKTEKYSGLPPEFQFVPLAFETLGPPNGEAVELLNDIGRRTREITGEIRESQFLFQRINILLQKFNAVAFHGSFITDERERPPHL